MSVWGPLEFGRGWQRIRTAVEAAMKADYTDQVVRPALGEWVDESMATTRGPSVLLLFILQPFQKQLLRRGRLCDHLCISKNQDQVLFIQRDIITGTSAFFAVV